MMMFGDGLIPAAFKHASAFFSPLMIDLPLAVPNAVATFLTQRPCFGYSDPFSGPFFIKGGRRHKKSATNLFMRLYPLYFVTLRIL